MKKILILEDNISNAEMVSTIFKEEGFETLTLLKADNLNAEIKAFGPDLVLMDVILEGADGRDLCNMIKVEFSALPVILMTAALLHNIKEIPCNPNAIITKPFDIYELSKRVAQLAYPQ